MDLEQEEKMPQTVYREELHLTLIIESPKSIGPLTPGEALGLLLRQSMSEVFPELKKRIPPGFTVSIQDHHCGI
jgi:hypothetical protein